MSDEIVEPNYTQVPNVLLDGMAGFSDPEFRVAMAVCRQIFGWHRQVAVMSISFIVKATGLSNVSVIKACASLVEKGLLEKQSTSQFGGANAFKMIVKEQPVKFTSKAPDGVVNAVHRVVNGVNRGSKAGSQGVVNAVHIKKDILKEIPKDNNNLHEATALWIKAFNENHDHPYQNGMSKRRKADESAMAGLLKSGITPEDIGHVATDMFEVARIRPNDARLWWSRHCQTVENFCFRFNEIRGELKAQNNSRPLVDVEDEAQKKLYGSTW